MDEEKTQSRKLEAVEGISLREAEESLIESAAKIFEEAIANYPGGVRESIRRLLAYYQPVGKNQRHMAKGLSMEENKGSVGDSSGDEGEEFLDGQESTARFLEMKRKQYRNEDMLYGPMEKEYKK